MISVPKRGCGGMADAADSKSADLKSYGFKSHQPHHLLMCNRNTRPRVFLLYLKEIHFSFLYVYNNQ